jgi:hypothetical protein
VPTRRFTSLQPHHPYDLEPDEWVRVVGELMALAEARDDQGVLGWVLR